MAMGKKRKMRNIGGCTEVMSTEFRDYLVKDSQHWKRFQGHLGLASSGISLTDVPTTRTFIQVFLVNDLHDL